MNLHTSWKIQNFFLGECVWISKMPHKDFWYNDHIGMNTVEKVHMNWKKLRMRQTVHALIPELSLGIILVQPVLWKYNTMGNKILEQ